MLIYFIWNAAKRDREISAEREHRSGEFQKAREMHLAAEKDSLLKYAELTRQVTEVISTVQGEINNLTDTVAELTALIRKEKSEEFMRIYLSPSNQPGNKYCVGNTNEKAQMEALAAKIKAILDKDYDCETVMATLNLGINLNERPKEAADKKCDFYLALHSNAAGSGTQNYATGVSAYYHPNHAKSKELAAALVKELNAVCPVKSNRASPVVNGMKAFDGAGYGEVRSPMQRGVGSLLLEVDFHDNSATCVWLVKGQDAIAGAVVKAIVDVFGIKKKAADPPVVPPQAPNTPQKLYRVQVGAFAVKQNAETMLERLKKAGFDGYVKYD
jgi:N-acetylmuramoyl-L-alanine amidase